MSRSKAYIPHGVIPACLLPFQDDFSIDVKSFTSHLHDVAAVSGITAITVNGHASEVASCTFEEQRDILSIATGEIGARLPLIAGVFAEGSLEAARLARMSQDVGASALLVFPPAVFTLGQRPEMVLTHFRHIADASDLPLIAFQYPLAGGQGYSMATLSALLDAVPTIRAVKDWTPQMPLHERHINELQARNVNLLSTNSAALMSSLVLGCAGLLSGAGSVIADLQVQLFQALQNSDLGVARRTYSLIRPVAEAFYANPVVDMHNRMKEALVILGRLPNATVRPPLVKLDAAEIDNIGKALSQAGLLNGGVGAVA